MSKTNVLVILLNFHLAKADTYINPVINSDYPDPGILRLPDPEDGYLGVVSSGNVEDAFPLIWSQDLVSWSPRGHVFPNGSWPKWAVKEMWAPEIHFVNGRYICYFAAEASEGSTKHSIGVAVSETPWGPYIDIGKPIVEQHWNCIACFIDPSYFLDPKTEKQFLLWKGDTVLPFQPSIIYMQELNENGTAFADNSEPIRILKNDRLSENMIVEGPWMMFKEGNYFLFYSSSWVTMISYKVEVALSSNITHQEFVKANIPVIKTREKNQCSWVCWLTGAETERNTDEVKFEGPGHGSVVEDGVGDWWLVYAVWKANHINMWPPGRLMMLDKISWHVDNNDSDIEWPFIGSPSETEQNGPQ